MTECPHGNDIDDETVCEECVKDAAHTVAPVADSVSADVHAADEVATADATPASSKGRFVFAGIAIAIAAIVVIALSVTGGGSSAAAAERVMSAATATSSSQSAQMELTMAATEIVNGATHTLNLTGNGAVDLKNNVMSLTMHFLNYPGISPTTTIDEILVGRTIYEGGAAFAGRIPGGKKWVAVTMPKPGSLSGAATGSLNSPGTMFTALRAQGNTVTDLGASTVHGVSVEKYQVAISASSIATRIDAINAPAAIKASVKSMFGSQNGVTYYVYVGTSDKMIHQMDFALTLTTKSIPITFSYSMAFSKFGSQVVVVVPPASNVYVLKTKI